ncbi:Wzz/FepE/Etk N-terminal domain-containing protein [Methylobacterium sp. J-048]|uniref:Wzz/FepE/Etk N-terminal domain-containing protein n=1 Tax=Methylobacterium sp. J-048 TaxID=2836635 RepID=UPI001FB96B0A|nr:Wzz/FepE/Etk N-terminal domain-containing protein [Methylobacterium sp. J-048]MCJ2055996.1 Wzz/FepE/Etk N-terminal domain-containing protein [Methylobacterium sp. J-048]
MSAHNQNRISSERPQAVWPFPEATSVGVPDGPLAVISAALKAAKRHKFVVALWILFCVGAAAFYAATATPLFTATATLLLEPRRQAGSGSPEGSLAPGLDVGRAESELQVLRSERLLTNVFNSLGLANDPEFGLPPSDKPETSSLSLKSLLGIPAPPPPSPEVVQQRQFETFAQQFTVRRVGQSYVVEVSYTSPNPNLARRVANAAVSAYLWQSIAAKADAAKNGAEFLQGRVNALSSQARSAAAAVTNGSLPEAPTPDADARVIGAALQPLRPSAPRKTLILGLGLTVGLVGGLLAVALRQALDRRIRTPQDLVQRVGIPCLAVMPDISRKGVAGRRGASDLRSATTLWLGNSGFASGIRDLRTSIQLALSSRPGDGEAVIALVGCTANSGTSLIGLNLARIIQESGRPVTMIDADIHGSAPRSLTYDFDTREGTCLADLIEDPARIPSAKLLDYGGIAVLPARLPNTAVNSRVYLGAPSFHKVIDHMRQTGYVILDLPPLSVSAETRAAARRADAVVIVAEAGRTTVDELSDAVNGLRSAGASVIGAILNRV